MPEKQPSVDLHQERLVPTVVRRPYRRLRVAKRVVTEQRTITVDVRREELVVEDIGLDGLDGLDGVDSVDVTDASAPPREPLVLVLSREVPQEVILRTEPVEVVRVHVEPATTLRRVSAAVRREQAEVTAEGGATLEPGPRRGRDEPTA